jgi:hypothetical protein
MISVIIDIETIKKACENYQQIYNHINILYNNKLEEYKNTKVNRKLFGFNIPWTQTTLYKQLGLDSYFTTADYRVLLDKLKVMSEVRKEMLETQQGSTNMAMKDWLFRDMQLDIIEYTERYKTYYTLSRLVSSGIQQVAVGHHEYNFISYWGTQDNLVCADSQ